MKDMKFYYSRYTGSLLYLAPSDGEKMSGWLLIKGTEGNTGHDTVGEYSNVWRTDAMRLCTPTRQRKAMLAFKLLRLQGLLAPLEG